jgi:hypothetical protein
MWVKEMNKNILAIGSIIACIILLVASLSPVVGYNSARSSVRDSPLFSVRTKRAIDQDRDELTSEYVGKGNWIPIPTRNSNMVLIQKTINRFCQMDDSGFSRLTKLIINHAYQDVRIDKDNIEEVITTLELLRTNPEIITYFIDDSKSDSTSFPRCPSSGGNWVPKCFINWIGTWIIMCFILIGGLITRLISCGYPTQLCCEY